jgi:hypothetical protein
VENILLEEFNHTDLHCMQEVGHKELPHDMGNMSKHVKSSVHKAQLGFGIICLGVGIAEHSV